MKKSFKKFSFVLIITLMFCLVFGACLSSASENVSYSENVSNTETVSDDSSFASSTVKLASPSKNGALKVKGTKLVDKNGKTVQLRGISTHGIAWFPQYINQSAFNYFHDKWHANLIRLAMYTSEYGGYCTGGNKKDLLNLIDKGVKYAKNADMYCIIDWHILSDGNPNTYLKQAKKFWKRIAKKYASYKNVIYEICNEPNGGTTWSQIKSYAKKIIKIIRKYDSDAVIIVGTPTWSQDVDQAAASPIKGYKNIMYSFHFYSGTHKSAMRKKLKAAVENGLPVFVTEFGICDASGNGNLNRKQANKWIALLNKYNISYCAWNLSNKGETAALLKSSCSKTSGFKLSNFSASGKWLYKTLKKY